MESDINAFFDKTTDELTISKGKEQAVEVMDKEPQEQVSHNDDEGQWKDSKAVDEDVDGEVNVEGENAVGGSGRNSEDKMGRDSEEDVQEEVDEEIDSGEKKSNEGAKDPDDGEQEDQEGEEPNAEPNDPSCMPAHCEGSALSPF